jgi:hypothetical protein
MSLENTEPGQDAQAGAVALAGQWNPSGEELVGLGEEPWE